MGLGNAPEPLLAHPQRRLGPLQLTEIEEAHDHGGTALVVDAPRREH